MKCPKCGSRDNTRKTSILDYLWVYTCVCKFKWFKSKFDAPGIRSSEVVNIKIYPETDISEVVIDEHLREEAEG